jgi:hypothetical protein
MSDDRMTNGTPVTLEELTAVLRRHEGPPHARSRPAEAMVDSSPEPSPRPPRWRRPRLVWTLAAVAAALLLGSGLGFGVGNAVTPSGSAGTNVVGFGFLPARGWTVVQTGTIDSTGSASAIAANVSLHPDDDVRGVPRATIAELPARGVVIRAVFTTRGDPGQDFMFPVATLPLDFAAAEPVVGSGDAPGEYRLRAAVGGHNVDARIYLGSAVSSAALAAAAQRQLSRLVVAAEQVTIRARPSTASDRHPGVTLFGTVDSGRANELVEIQGKACGQDYFTGEAAVRTHEGGTWSTEYRPFVTTTLRAVANGVASSQITVRRQAPVRLRRLPGSSGVFEVNITARKQFWHRRVLVQHRDRRLGTWRPLRSVLLTEQHAAGNFVITSARFKPRVRKGTPIRVVFPLSQARPCYLAGTSSTWRT